MEGGLRAAGSCDALGLEPKVHLRLPERLLHEFLVILSEDAPDELSRALSVAQMQALLRAYSANTARAVPSQKAALQTAIVAAIHTRGADGGFAKYGELSETLRTLK